MTDRDGAVHGKACAWRARHSQTREDWSTSQHRQSEWDEGMEQVFHELNTLRKTRAIAGGTPDEKADGLWDSGEDD